MCVCMCALACVGTELVNGCIWMGVRICLHVCLSLRVSPSTEIYTKQSFLLNQSGSFVSFIRMLCFIYQDALFRVNPSESVMKFTRNKSEIYTKQIRNLHETKHPEASFWISHVAWVICSCRSTSRVWISPAPRVSYSFCNVPHVWMRHVTHTCDLAVS